jgi:di/tricarboxylate transporter
MVYAPGNYRFLDFLRFGWPLSLLYALLIPWWLLLASPLLLGQS